MNLLCSYGYYYRLDGREVSIAAYRPRDPEFESRVEQFSKIVFRFLGKENLARKTLSNQVFYDFLVYSYVKVNAGEVTKTGTAALLSTNLSGRLVRGQTNP